MPFKPKQGKENIRHLKTGVWLRFHEVYTIKRCFVFSDVMRHHKTLHMFILWTLCLMGVCLRNLPKTIYVFFPCTSTFDSSTPFILMLGFLTANPLRLPSKQILTLPHWSRRSISESQRPSKRNVVVVFLPLVRRQMWEAGSWRWRATGIAMRLVKEDSYWKTFY